MVKSAFGAVAARPPRPARRRRAAVALRSAMEDEELESEWGRSRRSGRTSTSRRRRCRPRSSTTSWPESRS
eukprot:8839803-Pyramimonas_sp.AAC.1